jgi:hypothetical protein
MTSLYVLFIGFVFGLALGPILQQLVARVLVRVLGVGFFLTALAAFAQTAPASSSTEPAWLSAVLTQAWPIILVVIVLPALGWLSITGLPKLDAILVAHRDSKTAGAAEKTFYAAMLPVNHLLEQFVAAGLADLKANPSKTPQQAAAALASDAKAVLGADGAAALKDEAGVGADALTTYVTHALATKITDAQASAAAAAGDKVTTAVAAKPLTDVAAGLAAGPAKS